MNEGFAYRNRIGAEGEGEELLTWLSRRYVHSSRAVWKERIERGEVEMAGIPASPSALLERGAEVVWNRPPWREEEVPLHFLVLYEDDSLLAVAKPAGLPTMPGGGFLEKTLMNLVKRTSRDASPLHRLGRETTGLVLFAKESQARAHLSKAFRDNLIERTYLGLASGDPEWAEKTITTPIGPVPHGLLGTIHAATPDGREARTRIEVLERRRESFLFRAKIATGRPHQIRIHLAASEHPLVGDPLYLPGGGPREDKLPGEGGYLLHAHRLSFGHPFTGERIELEAPPPDALRQQRGSPAAHS